jgi:hypothetical protein
VADVATNFPGVTEAMLRLHGAYLREQQALAAQRGQGSSDPAADPVGEARRFVAARRNYFPRSIRRPRNSPPRSSAPAAARNGCASRACACAPAARRDDGRDPPL